VNITVIIPTKQRWDQLCRCLTSLFEADHANLNLTVLVGVHLPDDTTSALCNKRFPQVLTFEYAQKSTPGEIRNQLVLHSKPDFFLFLDDDIILPSNYFLEAKSFFKKNPTVLGGPDLCPPDATFFQRALGLAQMSPMISAHTRNRHGSLFASNNQMATEHDFILCNLWVHSKVFYYWQIQFPCGFQRNEENILLHHIKRRSQRFFFSDKIFVYHQKKKDVFSLIRAVYMSGSCRMRGVIQFPASFSPLFLAPLFFLLYLLTLLTPCSSSALVIPLLVFLLLILFYSIRLTSLHGKTFQYFFAIYSFHLVIILAYAIGTISGLKEFFVEQNTHRPS
jgi:glycosyltransferase involved in cell wall biosynthesis